MLNILQKFAFCFGIFFLFLISCQEKELADNKLENSRFEQKLLNNFYKQIPGNHGNILITADSLFFILPKKDTKEEHTFMLHYIKEDNSFINNDFNLSNKKFLVSENGTPANFNVFGVPLIKEDYTKIAIGEFSRKDEEIHKTWDLVLNREDVSLKKSLYTNELSEALQKDLLREKLDYMLKENVFFENNQGYSFLIGDDDIFVFKPKELQPRGKFMFHFLCEDNRFLNYSFDFNSASNLIPLELKDKSSLAVRIPVINEQCDEIRIGEFTSEGNIWVQFMSPEELKKNPLLKYHKEP